MKRSAVLMAMLTALALAGEAAPSAPAPSSDQATAYQEDAAHDGYMADANLAAPFTQVWSITLPGAASYPLIVDGMVFVTASDETVYALNQATGSAIWSHVLGGKYAWSAIAYDRGRIFAVNSDGVVTAFDAATGSVAWSEQFGDAGLFSAPPTATNGILYIGGESALNAVGESDGLVLWKQQVVYGDISSPAVTADGVYVSYAGQQVYDFDPLAGSLLWHRTSGFGAGGKTPVVADGYVFVRDGFGNLVLSPSTGATQGSFTSGPAPAVANGVAFMLSGFPFSTSTLTALAGAGLGTTNWTFTGDGNLDTAPLVVGNLVLVGSFGQSTAGPGGVYALDAATGATSWSTSTANSIPAPEEHTGSTPLVGLGAANGTLVVPAGNQLIAYRTAGAITNPPSNQSPPTIAGSALVNAIEAVDVGIWSGLPNAYDYQWELCDAAGANCGDIAGATALSFVPPPEDLGSTLRVKVVGTNGVGSSTSVESVPSPVLAAPPPPAISAPPTVSGTPAVGHHLSTTTGTWTNSPTSYAYQWQRCSKTGSSCIDIKKATSSQYTLVAADVGHEVRSEVIASNVSGPAPSGYAPSSPTKVVVTKPVGVTLPKLSGVAKVGRVLLVSKGTWKNLPAVYAYRWLRCTSAGTSCKAIPGAKSRSHRLIPADAGHKLEAKVTASNAAGSAAAMSKKSGVITT